MGKPKARSCVKCGYTFTGSHLHCASCRRIERNCVECGGSFKGQELRCSSCRRTERNCVKCNRTYEGHGRRCPSCSAAIDRACVKCGKTFNGPQRHCGACRGIERNCVECGGSFKGHERRCTKCRQTERTCIECGASFKGRDRRCSSCRALERTCTECGNAFKGGGWRCYPCRWQSQPLEVRTAYATARGNARRARKFAAEVAGPVPSDVYEAIRGSGPCVYCGAGATTVDHVRPLYRGGWEHESNLVPACKACNSSKGTKFLTEWRRRERVEHGVAYSPKVAAEYDRLTAVAA